MSLAFRSSRVCPQCLVRLRSSPARISLSGRSISTYSSSGDTWGAREMGKRAWGRKGVKEMSTSSSALGPKVSAAAQTVKRTVDMSQFPPERIRNLSIIAHIDHGKSTLADRLLQMTGTVPPESSPQFLDKLKVEKERGITVKAQTVSIIYTHTNGHKYLINLIDTPGHVDFSYEVSRSLGACEGALLLVDCSQGIQAQTLSVFHHALEADLSMLAVINKVDLPHAYPDETSEEIASSLGLEKDRHLRISAKSGLGVDTVLSSIIEGLPSPSPYEGGEDGKLRGLIFDTFYDQFRGVVSLVRIFSGSLKKGDKVRFLQADRKYEILEVGLNNPDEVPVDQLTDGQVGYIVCNMKDSGEAFIGDTICWADRIVEPLPGFQPMKAMVYAGVFPMDSGDFPKLEESIERLTLNDRSVSVQRESSAALSQGFRLGFLGTLHMDVFRQRLEDEYSSEVIVTAPTVPYKVVYTNGTEQYISNPVEFPEPGDPKARVAHVEEPMINATIFVPNEYIGSMMDLCARYRGIQLEYRILENSERAVLRYSLPLSEIVTEFFSELKSQSSGFASFDYEEAGHEQSLLVKMNILINGKPVDALSMIVHKYAAQSIGKAWVKKLKEVVPRQQFELSIQAAIGAKVIARENVSAFRKDVTAGLYGGHYDRKLKHLNKQKEGKKKLKKLAGNIEIPQSAYYKVLSSRPRGFATSARSTLGLGLGMAGSPQPPLSMSGWGFERSHTSAQAFSSSSQSDPKEAAEPFQSTDPILPHISHLSGPSSTSPKASEPKPEINPIIQHTLSPVDRSSSLSHLLRLASLSTTSPSSSTLLLQAYTDLYMASPHTQLFTVGEVSEVLKALRMLQVREGADKERGEEQMEALVEEIKDLVGGRKGLRGLELLVLSSKTMQHRQVREKDVFEVEKTLKSLFPRAPDLRDELARRRFKAGVNYAMYLLALSQKEARFEDWWDMLEKEGLKPDGYTWLARMILAERMGRGAELSEIMGHALQSSNMAKEDHSVLVNYALAGFGRMGRWDLVVDVYRALRPATEEEDLVTIESATSPSSPDFRANIQLPDSGITLGHRSYSPLLAALSAHGNLPGSLTILKHIFEDDRSPSVADYNALFRGFAQYGEIPSSVTGAGPAGIMLGVSFNGSLLKSGDVKGSFEERMSGIWERGAMFGGVEDQPRQEELVVEGWSLETLEGIFESFMTLHPSMPPTPPSLEYGRLLKAARETPSYANAPGRKAVWTIMRAFARVTGGDDEALRRVWERLEGKFGEQGSEGWRGWREDGRLKWLKKNLYEQS
ncbi:GTP-binding protein LepA [Cryptococcus sp. DSM 104548]